MKVQLPNVRLSFPSLFRKACFNGIETKYEATFLLDKDKHADIIEALQEKLFSIIKEKLKGAKLTEDKICLKDGEDVSYAGYQNAMSLKASNAKRPLVLDRDKTPLTEEDDRLYAGCYVNAVVELWAQNNAYGKRVNANLLGVQFVNDGEPFSDGIVATPSDFDIFGDSEEEIPF